MRKRAVATAGCDRSSSRAARVPNNSLNRSRALRNPTPSPVAGIGAGGTPTPQGQFYVLDRLSDFSSPIYGPLAFGTNARSPTLTDWPGGGVVVNISSIAARTAMGSNVMYCASKAALDNMTQSLARALAPAVRVISVSPGLVDGEFVKSLNPEWRNQQAKLTPLGRLTLPAEVAAAVVAAVRDLTFTTGCVLAIDGGRPLN